MRLLFVCASLCLFGAAASVVACSADPAAVATKADAGSGDDDDDDTTADPGTTDTPDPGTGTIGGGDAGVDPDATTVPPTTGGQVLTTAGDGGAACDIDAFREQEPNNDQGTGNPLVVQIGHTKICGQVTSGDPDFITFKMPITTQSYHVQPSGGGFDYSGTINGAPFADGNFPPSSEVAPGDTWIVKIETTNTTARAWQLDFEFDD